MENTYEGEMTALEDRANVASLEGLHAERRKLLDANDRLIALHGPFGLFGDFRKKMIEAQKIAARMSPLAGIKVTDDSVDAMAHASDEYAAFLDTALEEKIAYLHVSNEITEIEERIRNREIALSVYGKEATLR